MRVYVILEASKEQEHFDCVKSLKAVCSTLDLANSMRDRENPDQMILMSKLDKCKEDVYILLEAAEEQEQFDCIKSFKAVCSTVESAEALRNRNSLDQMIVSIEVDVLS